MDLQAKSSQPSVSPAQVSQILMRLAMRQFTAVNVAVLLVLGVLIALGLGKSGGGLGRGQVWSLAAAYLAVLASILAVIPVVKSMLISPAKAPGAVVGAMVIRLFTALFVAVVLACGLAVWGMVGGEGGGMKRAIGLVLLMVIPLYLAALAAEAHFLSSALWKESRRSL